MATELVAISGQLIHRPNAAGGAAPAGNGGNSLRGGGRDLFCLFLCKYHGLRQLTGAVAVS